MIRLLTLLIMRRSSATAERICQRSGLQSPSLVCWPFASALIVPVRAEHKSELRFSSESGSPQRLDDSPKVDSVPSLKPTSRRIPSSGDRTPPVELRLKSNRQLYDAQRSLFVASGDVQVTINGGVLQADRIEFDSDFNTLFARGSVRFRKGSQYFQASTLRLSLIQGSGEMEDVYGVLDLDTAALDLNPFPEDNTPERVRQRQPSNGPERPLPVLESSGLGFPSALDIDLDASTAERLSPQGDDSTFWELELPPSTEWLIPEGSSSPSPEARKGMACPPELPPNSRLASPSLGCDDLGRPDDRREFRRHLHCQGSPASRISSWRQHAKAHLASRACGVRAGSRSLWPSGLPTTRWRLQPERPQRQHP